ncbi:MAG TPA: hypothetical protein VN039_16910 [Nitrospira sp.]|nr:hypothetical protein [Nitrospira sp.]
MTAPFVDPVILPPDIETLASNYLTTALSPTPIATRLPSPTKDADTVNGFCRVEYGGGSKPNRFHWDVQIILHGYSPNEIEASLIARRSVALLSAARGQTVSDGTDGWFVVGVMGVVAPHRLTDPDVILPRYRASVTWRVAGQQWNP